MVVAHIPTSPLHKVVSRGRLRWFGHVERKGADDWVSECRRLEVVGGVGKGGIGRHG